MNFIRQICLFSALLLCAISLPVPAQTIPTPGVLHPADMTKILPNAVFFRGQSATTQLRNSGGVRYADGFLTLATLVDNSGYSTGIQEKYQAYFITEVPLDIEGHQLVPGAYGVGILRTGTDLQFVVQDVGAHDLFQAAAANDAAMHRPVPLQVVAVSGTAKYRLYMGRNYVEFERAQ